MLVELIQSKYLTDVEGAPDLAAYCFERDQDGNPTKVLNGVFIAGCKDKLLRNTKSWSSNILLKVHFLLKSSELDSAKKSPQEFSAAV